MSKEDEFYSIIMSAEAGEHEVDDRGNKMSRIAAAASLVVVVGCTASAISFLMVVLWYGSDTVRATAVVLYIILNGAMYS